MDIVSLMFPFHENIGFLDVNCPFVGIYRMDMRDSESTPFDMTFAFVHEMFLLIFEMGDLTNRGWKPLPREGVWVRGESGLKTPPTLPNASFLNPKPKTRYPLSHI